MAKQLPVLRLYPGEFGLLALLIIVSGYMWYGSYQYDAYAGSFPRTMAVIVLAMSSVLLVRRMSIFPDRIRNIIESDADTFTDVEETFGDDEADETESEERGERQEQEPNVTSVNRKATFLGLITGLYMLVGYLVGLLWITPFYVLAYLRYTKQSWAVSLGIAVAVTVVTYGMMVFFNIRLETGWLLETYQIEVPLTILAESIAAELFHPEVN